MQDFLKNKSLAALRLLKSPWFVLKLLLALALGFNFGSRFELIAESVVDIWIEYLSDRFCCLKQLTITLTHSHLCPVGLLFEIVLFIVD